MGLFLSASGILSPDGVTIRAAIAKFVEDAGGTFEPRSGTTDDRNIGVIQSTNLTTTILYPDGFSEWDKLSQYLSIELKTPVFSFHIHDGDFWMFVAFKDGQEVAWFNPIPDYWEEVDDAERRRWAGDAQTVATLVPGIAVTSLERYFIPWTEDVCDAEQKSYPDDEFPIGRDWQLTDFMRRLGFVYPLDDSGKPTGETFYLKIRRKRSDIHAVKPPSTKVETPPLPQPSSKKPWWKFW